MAKEFIADDGKVYPTRKEYVKEQRNKLKKNPSRFFKENVIDTTVNYWKERPFHAFGTFVIWILIFYLIGGIAQAIVFDAVYCDCTIDSYDGKLMYVYNDFVDYYNEQANNMQQNYGIPSINEQEALVMNFNEQYSMYCTHDWGRWKNETVKSRIETTTYGLKKILLKRG